MTYLTSGIDSGSISMWHGLIADIPAGWVLCDGTNSTPDLRGSFARGAAAATEAGGTGGSDTHILTIAEMPAHTHNVYMGNGAGSSACPRADIMNETNTWSFSVDNAGSGSAHDNKPSYYEILYIMKT